jgi:hypothetical protein
VQKSRVSTVTLGVLTAWSPVVVVASVAWFFASHIWSLSQRASDLPEGQLLGLMAQLVIMIALHVVTFILLSFTTLYYAAHVIRNPELKERQKVVWSIVNVTVGVFVMPVYWYLYLWRARGVAERDGSPS